MDPGEPAVQIIIANSCRAQSHSNRTPGGGTYLTETESEDPRALFRQLKLDACMSVYARRVKSVPKVVDMVDEFGT